MVTGKYWRHRRQKFENSEFREIYEVNQGSTAEAVKLVFNAGAEYGLVLISRCRRNNSSGQWHCKASAGRAKGCRTVVSATASIQSMAADFIQETVQSPGKAPQVTRGHMTVERPDRFRWDVKEPYPQLVIAGQGKVTVYDPDLEQAVIRKMDQSLHDTRLCC